MKQAMHAAAIVGAILMMLAGCDEMVENEKGDEPVPPAPVFPTRCDADQDWYIDKPIALIYISGEIEYPRDDDERDVADDALDAVEDEYEGRSFTLKTFEALQKALFATGLYQDGDRKWGIETVARPGLPIDGRAVDPTIPASGCTGVELMMYGRHYLPQEPWDRPLRLVP